MKRTPLKRRVSLRASFIRKLKRDGTRITRDRRNGKLKRVKPLKKVSRSHRHKLACYYALRDEFLQREENSDCRCCIVRREHNENILLRRSTEVHHSRGRIGSLLNDERFWIPTCYDCGRHWIHQHPRLAREYGLLASAAEWNVSVPLSSLH